MARKTHSADALEFFSKYRREHGFSRAEAAQVRRREHKAARRDGRVDVRDYRR